MTGDKNVTFAKNVISAGASFTGLTSTSNGTALRLWNGFVYLDSSSAQYKENITTYTDDPFVMLNKLHPKTFNYKADVAGSNTSSYLGLLAEDVALVDKQYVSYLNDGDECPHSVNYDRLVVPLIAAVEQLKKKN